MESKLESNIQNLLVKALRSRHEAESALHEPSGKLSAGQLGKPLLEQVLKIIGVPSKPIEDYTLGVFARGNQVEDWAVKLLEPEETQKEVSYRGVIGFVDAMKDGMPIEVKSLKNSAIAYIDPNNEKRNRDYKNGGLKRQYTGVKYAHALQGGLYALGTEASEFIVMYVSADDLRAYPHLVKTENVKPYIDNIITEVATQLKSGTLPPYEPRIDFDGEPIAWQVGDKATQYSSYPEWISLDEKLLMTKLERQFPDAFKRLETLRDK